MDGGTEGEPERFVETRHLIAIDADRGKNDSDYQEVEWRLRERMRTVSVALVLCLNIGVDPPDVVKPSNCARLECWVDPLSLAPRKALKAVGNQLQQQYERWQPRARYRQLLDPTAEEVRKLCMALRRVATEERVLFHYCGHGVPRPTMNGEIWVYNKGYTQYIPLSLFDLQTWMGSSQPAIYVFDCSAAGLIIETFNHFMAQRKKKLDHRRKAQSGSSKSDKKGGSSSASAHDANDRESPPVPKYIEQCRTILLGACGAKEILPANPELPADVFTACLTTPIKMALRWFTLRSVLTNVPLEMIDKLPGLRKPNNRKSPFGELNWIFTAITDSMAWNVLPRDLFHKLFRQDLLVASLFRNFLLAQRILKSMGCTAQSCPALPLTHRHPMWEAWDLAADFCLSQLEKHQRHGTPFKPSTFFEQQLTGFEVWLEFGSEKKPPPMQLPVVLQVLLSQGHRLRALQLLARFLDKGPWAVNLALSVGIFPYVLKLLQSPARDLREVLVFIWAKILSLDQTCQNDLMKPTYCSYFLSHLRTYAGRLHPMFQQQQCHAHLQRSRAAMHGQQHPQQPPNGQQYMLPQQMHPHSQQFLHLQQQQRQQQQAHQQQHLLQQQRRQQQMQLLQQQKDQQQRKQPQQLAPQAEQQMQQQQQNQQQKQQQQKQQHQPPQQQPPQQKQQSPQKQQPQQQQRQQQQQQPQEPQQQPHQPQQQQPHQTPQQPHRAPHHPQQHPQAHHQQLPRQPYQQQLHQQQLHQQQLHQMHQQRAQNGQLPGHLPPRRHPMPKHSHPHGAYGRQHGSGWNPRSAGPPPQRGLQASLADPALQQLLAAFVLACIARNHPKGQNLVLTAPPDSVGVPAGQAPAGLQAFAQHLGSPDPMIRKWMCLCIAKLWEGFDPAKNSAAQEQLPQRLCALFADPVPEIRSSAIYALGRFMGGRTGDADALQKRGALELRLGATMAKLVGDASPFVRRELAIALAELVYHQQNLFAVLASVTAEQASAQSREGCTVWKAVLACCRDPFPEVAAVGLSLRRYVKSRALFNAQMGHMMGGGGGRGLGSPTLPNRTSSAVSPPPKTNSMVSPDKMRSPDGPHQQQQPNRAPLKHFNRHKMSHMRNRATGPMRRTEQKGEAVKQAQTNGVAGVDGRDNDPMWTVPKSAIYERSARHFRGALLTPGRDADKEEKEATLQDIMEAKWKAKHHRQTLRKSAALREKDMSDTTFVEVAFFDTHWEQTSIVKFHPFQNMLVAADSKHIGVWDYKGEERGKERISVFRNENVRGSHITSLDWVNETRVSMLLSASDDGVVRLWKDIDKQGKQSLVSAWTADPAPESAVCSIMNDAPFTNRSPLKRVRSHKSLLVSPGTSVGSNSSTGSTNNENSYRRRTRKQHRQRQRAPALVVDWQQQPGVLLASGHGLDTIKIWDVQSELPPRQIPLSGSIAGAPKLGKSYVTSLCSTRDGNAVYAGCHDGTVRVFDLRSPSHKSLVSCSRQLNGAIVQTHLPRGDPSATLVSASIAGDVLLSDARMSGGSSRLMQRASHQKSDSTLDALAVHDNAPVIASGSHRPFIEVFGFDGTTYDNIRYHIGFLGQRIGPVTSLSFHSNKLLLAAGALDSYISIFAGEKDY